MVTAKEKTSIPAIAAIEMLVHECANFTLDLIGVLLEVVVRELLSGEATGAKNVPCDLLANW